MASRSAHRERTEEPRVPDGVSREDEMRIRKALCDGHRKRHPIMGSSNSGYTVGERCRQIRTSDGALAAEHGMMLAPQEFSSDSCHAVYRRIDMRGTQLQFITARATDGDYPSPRERRHGGTGDPCTR